LCNTDAKFMGFDGLKDAQISIIIKYVKQEMKKRVCRVTN